jgi:hypothetical protein
MRSRCTALILVAITLIPAASPGAGVGRKRSERVTKATERDDVRLFPASPLSQTEIYVTITTASFKVGSELDIIDTEGYLGRARIVRVETNQGTCPGQTIANAVAKLDGARMSGGPMVAMVPRRRPKDAKVYYPEAGLAIPDLRGGGALDIGVDLDGDTQIDVVRANYECPNKVTQGQGTAYCTEFLRRRNGKWESVALIVYPECW